MALWPSLRENLRRGRGTGRPETSHCVTLINSPVTIYTQSVRRYLIASADQDRNHINCIIIKLIRHNYNNARRPRQRSRYSDLPWAGWSGDWIPVGVRFSAPIQTGPEGHPTICTTGTGSRKCVIPVVCVKIGNGMQSNTTVSHEVYLMTI